MRAGRAAAQGAHAAAHHDHGLVRRRRARQFVEASSVRSSPRDTSPRRRSAGRSPGTRVCRWRLSSPGCRCSRTSPRRRRVAPRSSAAACRCCPTARSTLSGPGSGRSVTKPTALRRELVQSTPMQLGPTNVTPLSSAARASSSWSAAPSSPASPKPAAMTMAAGTPVTAALRYDGRRMRPPERHDDEVGRLRQVGEPRIGRYSEDGAAARVDGVEGAAQSRRREGCASPSRPTSWRRQRRRRSPPSAARRPRPDAAVVDRGDHCLTPRPRRGRRPVPPG